mgnify:CR=1 FL=1
MFEDNDLDDYGMVLLRNRFFKSCAFCTRLQDWFKDNDIIQIRQLGGYTTARKVSDIKLVITESSLKYLKFVPKGKSLEEGFRTWLDNVYEGKDTSAFGVVKTDQLPSNMGGAMTYTNYQLLNTVPIALRPESLVWVGITTLKKDLKYLKLCVMFIRKTYGYRFFRKISSKRKFFYQKPRSFVTSALIASPSAFADSKSAAFTE